VKALKLYESDFCHGELYRASGYIDHPPSALSRHPENLWGFPFYGTLIRPLRAFVSNKIPKQDGAESAAESSMWMKAATPERLAELFHKHEIALGIYGKGRESGMWKSRRRRRIARSPLQRTVNSGE
jgi:hypothetical protein